MVCACVQPIQRRYADPTAFNPALTVAHAWPVVSAGAPRASLADSAADVSIRQTLLLAGQYTKKTNICRVSRNSLNKI